MQQPPGIEVGDVWQSNLHQEFNEILEYLPQYPYITIDTEFPGTIYKPKDIPKHLISSLSPSALYSIMKKNVDDLHLIQLGLTLSDVHGNLPLSDSGIPCVWQFNFREFDCDRDNQNQESISLLKSRGMDFNKNKEEGVDSREFAVLFKCSNLGRGHLYTQTWITFHGLYHFGFLIKILTGNKLPQSLDTFIILVKLYFGISLYDLKVMAQLFGLQGGLEKIANGLGLTRVVGKSHQAGADSLLAMQVFKELMRRNQFTMERYNYELYGLTHLHATAFRNCSPVSPLIYEQVTNNKIEDSC